MGNELMREMCTPPRVDTVSTNIKARVKCVTFITRSTMRLSGVIACVAVVLRFCSAEISSIGLRGKLECPPNERYYEMRPSACSKDCESIGKPCKEQSKIPHNVRSGCDCREGFYRMQKTGKCLPTIECLRKST